MWPTHGWKLSLLIPSFEASHDGRLASCRWSHNQSSNKRKCHSSTLLAFKQICFGSTQVSMKWFGDAIYHSPQSILSVLSTHTYTHTHAHQMATFKKGAKQKCNKMASVHLGRRKEDINQSINQSINQPITAHNCCCCYCCCWRYQSVFLACELCHQECWCSLNQIVWAWIVISCNFPNSNSSEPESIILFVAPLDLDMRSIDQRDDLAPWHAFLLVIK